MSDSLNPGPIKEAGKVASGFVAAMATNPPALALVVCNILLLGLFFYAVSTTTGKFRILMAQQQEVQKMLYNCTPTRPTGLLQLELELELGGFRYVAT